jgi:hypothetical protein
MIKIGASLVAVGSSLICVQWVFQRRQIEDVNALLGFRRRIWSLAAVAALFATPALYLGLIYFREYRYTSPRQLGATASAEDRGRARVAKVW